MLRSLVLLLALASLGFAAETPRRAVARLGTIKPRPDFVVYCARFTPDGKAVVFGSEDGSVRRGGLAAGDDVEKIVGHFKGAVAVAVAPDGRTIASGDHSGEILICSYPEGDVCSRLTGPKRYAACLAFTPDGTTLIAGGEDGTVTLWSLASSRQVASFKAHDGCVCTISLSKDGKRLVTGSRDGRAILWDVPSRKRILAIVDGKAAVKSVSLSPDGGLVAVGVDSETHVRILDLDTSREKGRVLGDDLGVLSVSWSPDGKRLATSGLKGVVRIHDWKAKTSDTFVGHRGIVRTLDWSPDGSRLASGSDDATVLVWDVTP